MLYKKSCCYKLSNIDWKRPVLESLFNNVAGHQACSFINKRLQWRRFPVNIAKLLRTPWWEHHFEEHLQKVASASWKRLQGISWRYLQCNNFSSPKTSSRRLGKQEIFTLKMSCFKNMPWWRLQDMLWRYVLKSSYRHLGDLEMLLGWNLHLLLTNLKSVYDKSNKPISGKCKGLFIWRWAGPVRWAGSPRWDLTFLKKLYKI